MQSEPFKSLRIDVDKNIYEVNGRDVSKSGYYLNLVFEHGEWSLIITEDQIYNTSNHDVKV